jgi:hypothetical protein
MSYKLLTALGPYAPAFHRLIDTIEAERAFFPYDPEMLDFDLPENQVEEKREVVEYFASFGVTV